MSAADTAIVAAAVQLVGTPFRLHGREPAGGLDCVGVVLSALAAAGRSPVVVPPYTLRRTHLLPFDRLAAGHGLSVVDGAVQAGDLLVGRVGPAQFHTAVALDAGRVVHAHAGLRRVVCGPLPDEWTQVRHWRLLT